MTAYTRLPHNSPYYTRRPTRRSHTVSTPAAPTEKQLSFIRSLLAERQGVEAAEIIRTTLNEVAAKGALDRKVASATIETLLAIPRPPKAGSGPKGDPMPDVPEGRYALDTDEGVKFYRVDRPSTGKWQGWTFVKVQASDDYWPIKGESRRPILEAIAADPQGASARYGHELGHCGVCGKTLTDEESRARGIGPVCAGKMGW